MVEEVGKSGYRDVVGVEGQSSVVERREVTLLRFFAARTNQIQYLFLNFFPRVSVLCIFPLPLIPHGALSVASCSPSCWFFWHRFLNVRELLSFEMNWRRHCCLDWAGSFFLTLTGWTGSTVFDIISIDHPPHRREPMEVFNECCTRRRCQTTSTHLHTGLHTGLP